MAFRKFIRAILDGEQIEVFGNGEQTRDFTFVSDIVKGTALAINAPAGEKNSPNSKFPDTTEVLGILLDWLLRVAHQLQVIYFFIKGIDICKLEC